MRNIPIIQEALNTGFCNSGFSHFMMEKESNGLYSLKFSKSGVNYHITAYIRTVGKSGWDDKPHIRRTQISSFNVNSLYTPTSKNISMILGIERVFERYIYIIWDVYKYTTHKTNRSCYVHVSNIFKTFLTGFHITTDSNQRIWLSDQFHLDKILNSYFQYNLIDSGEDL